MKKKFKNIDEFRKMVAKYRLEEAEADVRKRRVLVEYSDKIPVLEGLRLFGVADRNVHEFIGVSRQLYNAWKNGKIKPQEYQVVLLNLLFWILLERFRFDTKGMKNTVVQKFIEFGISLHDAQHEIICKKFKTSALVQADEHLREKFGTDDDITNLKKIEKLLLN